MRSVTVPANQTLSLSTWTLSQATVQENPPVKSFRRWRTRTPSSLAAWTSAGSNETLSSSPAGFFFLQFDFILACLRSYSLKYSLFLVSVFPTPPQFHYSMCYFLETLKSFQTTECYNLNYIHDWFHINLLCHGCVRDTLGSRKYYNYWGHGVKCHNLSSTLLKLYLFDDGKAWWVYGSLRHFNVRHPSRNHFVSESHENTFRSHFAPILKETNVNYA